MAKIENQLVVHFLRHKFTLEIRREDVAEALCKVRCIFLVKVLPNDFLQEFVHHFTLNFLVTDCYNNNIPTLLLPTMSGITT